MLINVQIRGLCVTVKKCQKSAQKSSLHVPQSAQTRAISRVWLLAVVFVCETITYLSSSTSMGQAFLSHFF